MKKVLMLLVMILGIVTTNCTTEVEPAPSCNCEYVSYTQDVTSEFSLTERTRTAWEGCEEQVLLEETTTDAFGQEWYYLIKIECQL